MHYPQFLTKFTKRSFTGPGAVSTAITIYVIINKGSFVWQDCSPQVTHMQNTMSAATSQPGNTKADVWISKFFKEILGELKKKSIKAFFKKNLKKSEPISILSRKSRAFQIMAIESKVTIYWLLEIITLKVTLDLGQGKQNGFISKLKRISSSTSSVDSASWYCS